MTEQDSKQIHILIKDNAPTGVTSTAYDANVDAVGFNINFILSKNPTLALAIMKLYKEAHAITPDDPSHPEEDYSSALSKIKDLLK